MAKNNKVEKGVLYIVATPIGNLEDISLRAIRAMKEADLIAAEDTRHTKKLLKACDLSTPLISLHGHNEKEKSSLVIDKIKQGKNIAYVTDAGTPCVSDPGYFLVSKAHDENIKVVPIPGPSAVTAALSASGFSADSFVFCGFLPARENKRKKFLKKLIEEERTIVFYESPVRFLGTLRDMLEILGDRKIVLAREVTKIFEEIKRGEISEFIDDKADTKIKGEITVIVQGVKMTSKPISEDEIKQKISETKKNKKLTLRDTVALVAEQTGMPRKKVYEIGIKLEKE